MVFSDIGAEGGGAEETLRVTIVFDASQAIKNAEAFRELVNKIKEDLRSLKEQSGLSMKDLGQGLKDAFVATPGISKAQYGKAITQAMKEIGKEEKTLSNVREQSKEHAIRSTNELKQTEISAARDTAKEKIASVQQYAKAQTQLNQETVNQNDAWVKKDIALAKLAEKEKIQSARNTFNAVKEQAGEIRQKEIFVKELERGPKTGFLGWLQNLGVTGQAVFGAVFGITAIGVLRQITRLFMEAAQSGYEFAKAMFQMEVGVRALQRAGIEITIQAVYENLRKLKNEFGIFAYKDLVAGSAAFFNLNRDMGFTQDQLFELQKSVATLAVVNGRSMDEVQKTVALALSSGYTEGLQRLGVSINRVTIAQEAATMGWRNGYTALTEVQRAAATYNLIIRKTKIYQDDLLKYQNTAPGEIDRLTASLKDLKTEIGSGIIPVLGAFAGAIADITVAITGAEQSTKDISREIVAFVQIMNALVNPMKAIGFLLNSFDNAWTRLLQSFKAGNVIGIKEIFTTTFQSIRDAFQEISGTSAGLGDVASTPEAEAERQLEKIQTAVSDHVDDVEKIIEDGGERRKELEDDLQRDLEQMQRESLRRREELERDYQRKVADINRDSARDVEAANRQYADDLADLTRDTTRREQELRDKQRQTELDDEKKFQEKMRKLRADFLFDLEEAVRSRDAVQIRRLQRRFEFERNELLIERDQEKKDRADDFRRELEDLRRQAAEKRRELAIQFAQKLEDIARQRQFELQDAALKHAQDLEDLRREEAEKRKERMLAYRQELDDLARKQNDRLRKVAEAIAQEVSLTGKGAQAVYDVLKAYFGPNGAIDQLFQYYIQAVGNVATSTNNALSGINNPNNPNPNANAGNYAYGGSFIADRPTTARFGERAGIPELVTATPLMASRNTFSSGGQGGAWSGNLSVLIKLSPGLEGAIVDKTLGEFDKVLASIERAR